MGLMRYLAVLFLCVLASSAYAFTQTDLNTKAADLDDAINAALEAEDDLPFSADPLITLGGTETNQLVDDLDLAFVRDPLDQVGALTEATGFVTNVEESNVFNIGGDFDNDDFVASIVPLDEGTGFEMSLLLDGDQSININDLPIKEVKELDALNPDDIELLATQFEEDFGDVLSGQGLTVDALTFAEDENGNLILDVELVKDPAPTEAELAELYAFLSENPDIQFAAEALGKILTVDGVFVDTEINQACLAVFDKAEEQKTKAALTTNSIEKDVLTALANTKLPACAANACISPTAKAETINTCVTNTVEAAEQEIEDKKEAAEKAAEEEEKLKEALEDLDDAIEQCERTFDRDLDLADDLLDDGRISDFEHDNLVVDAEDERDDCIEDARDDFEDETGQEAPSSSSSGGGGKNPLKDLLKQLTQGKGLQDLLGNKDQNQQNPQNAAPGNNLNGTPNNSVADLQKQYDEKCKTEEQKKTQTCQKLKEQLDAKKFGPLVDCETGAKKADDFAKKNTKPVFAGNHCQYICTKAGKQEPVLTDYTTLKYKAGDIPSRVHNYKTFKNDAAGSNDILFDVDTFGLSSSIVKQQCKPKDVNAVSFCQRAKKDALLTDLTKEGPTKGDVKVPGEKYKEVDSTYKGGFANVYHGKEKDLGDLIGFKMNSTNNATVEKFRNKADGNAADKGESKVKTNQDYKATLGAIYKSREEAQKDSKNEKWKGMTLCEGEEDNTFTYDGMGNHDPNIKTPKLAKDLAKEFSTQGPAKKRYLTEYGTMGCQVQFCPRPEHVAHARGYTTCYYNAKEGEPEKTEQIANRKALDEKEVCKQKKDDDLKLKDIQEHLKDSNPPA